MSQDCHCSENQTSSFIFGLFLGAIVAAVVAVLIYRHQKSKVVIELKKYFQDLIDRLIAPSSPKNPSPPKKTKTVPLKKIAVTLPPQIIKKEAELHKKTVTKSKPRVFKK